MFTSGLTIDTISGYTGDDIGAFDLSELEADDAVEDGETIDFVNGSSSSMLDGAVVEIQSISGAGPTTLGSSTNVIHYTSPVASASALETALEGGGSGIIRTNGALAENDAFIIQYQDSDTNTYSYAIAHLEDSGVGAGQIINAWEVTDIATTDLTTAFSNSQFLFLA